MTPAQRAVIKAAREWRSSAQCDRVEGFFGPLADAVDALKQEQAGEEYAWADVVEGDEVFSPKANKWYKVRAVNPRDSWRVVQAEGVKKPWVVDQAGTVRVRRGATGDAVDTIVEVFRSR